MGLFKGIALLLLTFFLLSSYFETKLPDVSDLKTENPKETAFMGKGARHYWVPLGLVPHYVRKAVIKAEDGTFYQHKGIDFFEFKESVKKNWEEKSFARGFSTITMQLARNIYLSPRKSPWRKIKEILIARKMEQELTKGRILELYLNLIQWGPGIYGVEAASRRYFNKSVNRLTLEEGAFLAAIIPSPVKWGNRPPGPYVQQRIDRILRRIAPAEQTN